MRENEDLIIERKASEKGKSKAPAVLGICLLLLIAVMVISAVISEVSGVSVAEIGAEQEKGGIIYDTLPDSIKNIEKYSSGIVMLTDTAVDYLDSTGRKLASNSHQYSQPVMVPKASSILLYDKGGTSFRIEKNSKIYNTYTVANPITCASIDKRGNYAYVLNEDGGFQSHLYVYSYKGKKLFEWGSSSDYCIGTAISDNGKNIALSMLSVKNGEYLSKIIFFNFKANEAAYTVELPDCTVFRLEFLSGKNLAVFTDNGIYVIDKNGEYVKKADYSPSEIMHSGICDNGISCVALALHGNSKDSLLTVFNKKLDAVFTLEYNSAIHSVCSSDKYVAVLLGGSVEIYDAKGMKTGSITIDEKCFDVAFSGRSLYILTVSGIYSFDAYGEYDLTVVTEEETTGEFIKEETEESTTENEATTIGEEENTDGQEAEEATEAPLFG